MIRFILLALLAFVILKVIQTTLRILRSKGGGRSHGSVLDDEQMRKGEPQRFTDVKDADFEDITPKERKKADDAGN